MARASNIYHLYFGQELLGSWTVKYEVLYWAMNKSGYGSAELTLLRVRDGRPEEGAVRMPFEDENKKTLTWERPRGSKVAQLARKLTDQFIANGQMGG